MPSEIVYAIYDKNSNLFVTNHRNNQLDKLGTNTMFFESQSEAMRFIEYKPCFEFSDLGKNTVLQDNLAWWLLEKVYNTDRWHIDCGIKEFDDAASQFKNLKVVPINLEYNDNVVKS